jgi:hypothetical protein
MKYTIYILLIISSAFLQAKESADGFFSELINLNTYKEDKHIVLTKYTNNNNLKIFSHENIIYITEQKLLTEQNKIKVIKLITFLDQLIVKRNDIYSLSNNISSYHIISLTVNGENNEDTIKYLTDLSTVLSDLDTNIIIGIRQIQDIFKETQKD